MSFENRIDFSNGPDSATNDRIPDTSARNQWKLPLVLIVALLARILVSFPTHSAGFGSDEKEYLFLSQQIRDGIGFIDSNGEKSIKAPLYPAILALAEECTGGGLIVAFLLSAILGSVSVYIGYHFAFVLWKQERTALAAAWLIALFPPLVIYGSMVMSENLFIVLFLCSLLIAHKLKNSTAIAPHIFFGAVTGLATLARAVFFGAGLVMIALLFLQKLRSGTKPRLMVFAFVAWGLVLLPWAIRNYAIHEAFVPVSTFGGRSLLMGNNPFTNGTTRFEKGYSAWLQLQFKKRGIDEPDSLGESRRISIEKDIALEYMLTNPARTAGLFVRKACVFWVFPLSHQSHNYPLYAFLMVSDIILWLGLLCGYVVARKRHMSSFPILVSIAFISFTHVVLHAESRYRLPLVPLLCIIAAGAGFLTNQKARSLILSDDTSKRVLACGVITIVLAYGYSFWMFY